MAINKYDDYEALAKLLYPSIEASGNVYYGQTRKLTLDEVLKRNSLGFDSHIESFYNESDRRYDSYFCWRLGSLHGSIQVDKDHIVDGVTASDFDVPFVKRILYADSEEIIYDDKLIYYMAKPNEGYALDTSMVPIFGTIFAKYRLDKHSTAITNELHSGSYDSYEVDVEPVLEGIYVTDDFNPVNSIDDDISDRHFYISKEKGVDYLYIQILTNEDTSKILTFTALEDSEISLSMVQPTNGTHRAVFYRVSQDDGSFTDNWESYHYDWEVTVTPTGPISLNTGRKIQFKSHVSNIVINPNSDNCLKFVINSGTLFVSGSCISMCNPDTDESTIDTLKDYALYGLFSDVKNMYGTPVLPNVNKLGSRCYESMFMNCTSLTVAPKIKSSDTYSYISENDNYCYYNMFSGCVSLVSPPKVIGYYDTDKYFHSGIGTCDSMFIGCASLKTSPVIRYKTLGHYSCHNMFYGCSSLKVIRCGAKYIDDSSATESWAYGVSTNGVFIKSTTKYMSYMSGPDGIPEGWAVVTKDDDYFAVHKEPDHGFRIDKHTPSDNYKNDYLVTSGTDSSTNGRGYIANNYIKESTIGKMERSFDENNTHPMNTYNADGSFNQEIWGYKSFNSPVLFRNGIYSDGASILSSLPSFDSNITAFSVSDPSSGTIKQASINAIDYDLLIKFTGNARYREVIGSLDGTQISTSIVQDEKHIARFFSVDHTKISLDIESYIANNASTHSVNYTGECSFIYSELTVPGKASVYVKEKPSIHIVTDGDSISESTISSTVEAGIKVDDGVIRIEAEEGKPCDILISTGNGDMDMMIEMYHYKKDPAAGQEYDRSEVTIKLGNVTNTVGANAAIIKMTKRSMDISTESSVYMGITDENGSIDKSCIEINSGSGSGTHALIKADYVSINGNVQVNGTPINNT